MADALKTFFNPGLIRRLAGDLARVKQDFPVRRFVTDATRGLDALELLARGRHIAGALGRHLPSSYPEALAVLVASLGPEHASDELLGAGMAPFFYLPHTLFVAERGLDHYDISMQAQYELTKRFSAESSIRPFIARYPERTLDQLRRWSRDPNPHVRRLVSEGTRLRLPWAMRVPWLDSHPEEVVGLLELLKDDPAPLVRRSVANNLNDLGKVQPDLLIATCARWVVDATPERRAVIEHALRGAIKRGVPDALRLLGFGAAAPVDVDEVQISPARVRVGERVSVRFTLRNRSPNTADLLVDLAVHFVKARGRTSRKVFKMKRLSLRAGDSATLTGSVSLAVHTTRRPYPGVHAVDVVINGRAVPLGTFDVRGAATRQRNDGQGAGEKRAARQPHRNV